jgi:hypothetical protein
MNVGVAREIRNARKRVRLDDYRFCLLQAPAYCATSVRFGASLCHGQGRSGRGLMFHNIRWTECPPLGKADIRQGADVS